MDATERDLLRRRLLLILHAGPRGGMKPATLYIETQKSGFNAGFDEVQAELDYLKGKGLVLEGTSPISMGLRFYALAAAGIDLLEAEGELG